MHILTRIRDCAAEYEMSTGLKPTRVYLGKYDYANLKYNLAWLHNCEKEDVVVNKVGGMVVYEVIDEKEHIRCCV